MTVNAVPLLAIVKLPKRKVYLYNRADFNSISTKLEDLNHQLDEDSVKNMDIDKLWDTLTNTIQLAMDTNIPSKMTSSKPSVPWINSDIKRKIKKKRKLYNKARKTGDFELWDKFKELRRKNDREMRNLQRDHIRSIGDCLESNNTKPF